MCSRQAKLPIGNFDAAAWVAQKSPAGRPPGFCALSPRDLYGTFCLGPIQLEQGRPTPEIYARRWNQRKNAPSEDATFRLCRNLPGTAESRIPHALRLYEEKRVCTQLIRRLRGRRKAEPAWRREIKKRFCRLLGLWPKGGGRGHPCEGSTILFAAKPRRKSLFSRSAAAAGLQNRAAGYAAASNTTQQGR